MSVDKYKPHLYVIPEDRRDAQIANGFAQHPSVTTRQLQVMAEAGGWHKVLDTFREEYLPRLHGNQHTHVVMLIDFDGTPEKRRATFDAEIPDDVRDRVFVIGPGKEPEDLKSALGVSSFEDIGRALADDCARNSTATWGHDQLRHNENERVRLSGYVRSFLFN